MKKTLPKNIRQVGEGGSLKCVYLEDYAVTYMHQVKRGVLLGEPWRNKGKYYLFVDGAIAIEQESLDDAAWEEICREAKEHFPGKEIIGWFYRVEDEVTDLNGEVEQTRRTYFPRDNKLLVLYDEEEKDEAVYLTENGSFRRQNGYYIYYEKNEVMQEYMVRKNKGRSVEKEASVGDKAIHSFRKLIGEKKETRADKPFSVITDGECISRADFHGCRSDADE